MRYDSIMSEAQWGPNAPETGSDQTPSTGYPPTTPPDYTGNTVQGGTPPPFTGMQPAETKKPWYKKWWIWVLVAVFVLIGIAASQGGKDDVKTSEADETVVVEVEESGPTAEELAEQQSREAAEEEARAKAEAERAAEEEAAAQAEKEAEAARAAEAEEAAAAAAAEAAMTVGQRNAIRQGRSYLEFMAFSRVGLIEQLEFEGYSNDDATFAVDTIDPDWNEQAERSAQEYLDYMAFSREGLIDQLLFEGFTYEQAVYGVDAVGY